MLLGLVNAICKTMNYEDMIDFASETGLKYVEVACWPAGKDERRYAGVSHINADSVLEDDAYAKHIKDYAADKNVKISSLAYYPNTLDGDLEKKAAAIEHIKKLICVAEKLGVNMVTTFIGRDWSKTEEENLEIVKEVWSPIIALAEEKGVKIAIENRPMLFGTDQWPGGQNLVTTPVNRRKVFEIFDSPNFGINYDPSHFVWQMVAYI